MIKNRQEIQALINKYMSDRDGVKALGFIKYHNFDKKLLTSDYEEINDFFRENFDLNHQVIYYKDLLKDSEGNNWLEIETIYDLELLDELIALAIASNVLEENLLFRFENLSPILNQDPHELGIFSEEEYLKIMRNRIISSSKLKVSYDTLMRYKKFAIQKDYSIEEKKSLLIDWWDQCMKDEDDTLTRKIFLKTLQNDNIEGLIYLVYTLYANKDTALKISEFIKNDYLNFEIVMYRAYYYHATPEARKEIDIEIKKMFDEFSKINQKKKRLQ